METVRCWTSSGLCGCASVGSDYVYDERVRVHGHGLGSGSGSDWACVYVLMLLLMPSVVAG